MSTTTEKQINDSNDDFDWLEKAISENYIKYYDYTEFINKEEVSSGSYGNVSRANWRDSDTVMAIKYSYNSTIKEIVNEVNIIITNSVNIFFYHTFIKYIY